MHVVGPNVRRFLFARGLAELIPVFASCGVRTDEEFSLFCELEDRVKSAIVGDCGGSGGVLRLNVFQRVSLMAEFTEVVRNEFVSFVSQ